MPSLEKQIKLMTDWGVEIQTSHKVEAQECARLQREYDAIYVGTGLLQPSGLRAEGEDMPADVAEKITNSWGGITCDETGMTAVQGVLTGGDLVNDTADAISAIAVGIMNYLGVGKNA